MADAPLTLRSRRDRLAAAIDGSGTISAAEQLAAVQKMLRTAGERKTTPAERDILVDLAPRRR